MDGSNRIVRRIANIPLTVLHGVREAVDHGIGLMESVGRKGRGPNPQAMIPGSSAYQHHSHPQHVNGIPQEFVFLNTFEQQFGTTHPFFYACRFSQVLNMAENENKLVFVYLHSPSHPFSASFCTQTLHSEAVIQFLDTNFISWGALADRGEGVQMITAMKAETFPVCVVVASGENDDITILQQMEGPTSPSQLLEILQTVAEEQGSPFSRRRGDEEERRVQIRRLREEQDASYLASLKIDREKEKLRKTEEMNRPSAGEFDSKGCSQILIRLPSGERREKNFSRRDTMESVYGHVESMGFEGRDFRLVSDFPRKIFDRTHKGLTLEEAGLYPRGILFVEIS